MFIEVASCDGTLSVTCNGVGVFDTGARKLFNLMAAADGSSTHACDRHGCVFRHTPVGRRPPVLPSRRRKRLVWAAVGLGNAEYLAAIDAINAADDLDELDDPAD